MAAAQTSFLRRMATRSPLVAGTWAIGSVMFGYGFANPVLDAVGFASTAAAYLATDVGIERLARRHGDSGPAYPMTL